MTNIERIQEELIKTLNEKCEIQRLLINTLKDRSQLQENLIHTYEDELNRRVRL